MPHNHICTSHGDLRGQAAAGGTGPGRSHGLLLGGPAGQPGSRTAACARVVGESLPSYEPSFRAGTSCSLHPNTAQAQPGRTGARQPLLGHRELQTRTPQTTTLQPEHQVFTQNHLRGGLLDLLPSPTHLRWPSGPAPLPHSLKTAAAMARPGPPPPHLTHEGPRCGN